MGAAAGKSMKLANEQGVRSADTSKKVKEIGYVESFDNDDDYNIILEESQSSPRVQLSPKLFHVVHNRSALENHPHSPISRISGLDESSPTIRSNHFNDLHDDTEKSIMEITNFDDEDDDLIVDDNLATVSRYVDEKNKKRRSVLKNKRSPVNNRHNRRREDEIQSLSDDETTSVLSYDMGDDDGLLGEDEDKYDIQHPRSSSNRHHRKNGSPSSRMHFPASPTYHQHSPSSRTQPSPTSSSTSSYELPKIREASSSAEEKTPTIILPSSSSSSSMNKHGIRAMMKESNDVLLDLESSSSKHDDMINSTSSLHVHHHSGDSPYIDHTNAALLGLQRQKIWSYAHNAQLEREVQALQQQLAELDSTFDKHHHTSSSMIASSSISSSRHKEHHHISAVADVKTSSSHHHHNITRDAKISRSKAEPSSSSSSSSSKPVHIIANTNIQVKKNVTSIRSRANNIPAKPSASSTSSSSSSSSSRHHHPTIIKQDAITDDSISLVESSSIIDMNMNESGDDELEGSHSSIVDVISPVMALQTFKRKISSTKPHHHPSSSSSSYDATGIRRSKPSHKMMVSHDNSSDTDNDGDATVASHSQAINIMSDDKDIIYHHPIHPHRPTVEASSSTSSSYRSSRIMRPSLHVVTHDHDDHHPYPGIQSHPASTNAASSSTSSSHHRMARTNRSNSSTTSSTVSKASHKHPSTSADADPILSNLHPITTTSTTSYQPSSPHHSSPRALRSDQNKDVLRRFNRRQRKYHDSDNDLNSASEDESSTVTTSSSSYMQTPKTTMNLPIITEASSASVSSYQPSTSPRARHDHKQPTNRRNRQSSSIIKKSSAINPSEPSSISASSSSSSSHNYPSLELQSKWHEVSLLLRRRIETEADMQYTMAAAEAGLLYSDQLNSVAKTLSVLRGTISRWILPFDNNTRIDGQCSTPMSVLERMPESLRGKISDRQIHYLVSGANSVRQLVRVKIADDNDLEQAKEALKTTMDFFKKLQEESSYLMLTPYQLLLKLQY